MIINKQAVSGILDNLIAKKYQVYAPVKYKGLYPIMEKINAGSDVDLDYCNVEKPPKGILFPQTEELYEYDVTGEGVKVEENLDQTTKVVFGIRPCDAKASPCWIKYSTTTFTRMFTIMSVAKTQY